MLADQELEELTFQELAKNPEIELLEATDLREGFVKEDPLGLDPGFTEPADEFEDGERIDLEGDNAFDIAFALEKAAEERYGEDEDKLSGALQAIDEYVLTGRMPDQGDDWLRDTLVRLRKEYSGLSSEPRLSSTSPTIRVDVHDSKVVAVVNRSMADRVRVRAGVEKLSKRTQAFFQKRRERVLILNAIATHVLEDIQADFFLSDLRSALLALIPLPITSSPGLPPRSPKLLEYWKLLESVVEKLGAGSHSRINKSRLIRLGQLSVSSQLGVFPLALFWPQKAALVRVWVRAAEESGCNTVKAIREWLLPKLQERAAALSGHRLELFKPLLNLTEDDIRNALKARNRGHRRS